MNPLFNLIRLKKPKRNAFNLSHEFKFSCDMGDLVPILCEEVVPGDTFKDETEVMIRFAPTLAPVMHRIDVYTHFFFVPNRLLWDEWKTFITGGEDGTEMPPFPRINVTASLPAGIPNAGLEKYVGRGSLMDYLGMNDLTAEKVLNYRDNNIDYYVNALPIRAYNLIWNEYYRDQNLTEEIDINNDVSGDYPLTYYRDYRNQLTLKKRAWEKDYFTSALPWPQRGPEVTLPLDATVNIEGNGSIPLSFYSNNGIPTFIKDPASGETIATSGDIVNPNNGALAQKVDANGNIIDVQLDVTSSHYTKGSDVANGIKATANLESLTINELRRQNAIQRWFEKNARAGSRYIEQIFSHFGVKSSDARLQRPEYLGGGKTPVMVSEVMQNSATDSSGSETPLGTFAGNLISLGQTHQFKRYFEEHGWIIGIMSVLPRTNYQQGVPRKYTKYDKFDYYFPDFAHLGEQEILNREIYDDPLDGKNEEVFGYQSRYAEYKYLPSRVAGDFKDSLSFWHMGRIFENRPNLNFEFVESDPTDRIFAVEETNHGHLWCQVYHKLKAIRPMPQFGTPLF